jgi:hemerythrin-like domain-containing protein
MRLALRMLHEEHAALRGLLFSILPILLQARAAGSRPDFSLLRAMLFYIAEFPEKRHHRKESDLLFPKLRARTPLARRILDHLDEDHTRGEAKIRELEHALTSYEMLGDSQCESFETSARRYVDFYLAHMALEEREILPLAEQVLTEEDWDELDAAMALDHGPLAAVADRHYKALFSRIVFSAPAACRLVDPGAAHATLPFEPEPRVAGVPA